MESVYTKMFESTIIFKVLYYTKTPVKMCKPKHRLGSFISISIGLQEVLNTSLDHCFISFINICIGLQEVLQGQLGCKIAEAQNRKDWEGSSYNKYCIIIIIAVNTIWTSFNNINTLSLVLLDCRSIQMLLFIFCYDCG